MLTRIHVVLPGRSRLLTLIYFVVLFFASANVYAQTPPAAKPCLDFTGTGRTSFSTITGRGIQGNLVWNILSNGGDGSVEIYPFGNSGVEVNDGLSPGYYDGDNRADAGVDRNTNPFQPGSGNLIFYIRPSTLVGANPAAYYGVQWGKSLDRTGLQADYDGDGRDDITVARPEGGAFIWYILYSNTNTYGVINFGLTSDLPVIGADYTGDGRAEITVIRNTNTASTSVYYAGDAITGAIVLAQSWGGGNNRDVYVIGDYIGDRRADFAVARGGSGGIGATNATWYILENGGTSQMVIRQFGYGSAGPSLDLAVCGDYNGDGKQDIAVYRQSDRIFYWLNSPDFNTSSAQQWGQPNVLNIPVGFLHAFNR